jgi:hypothetical protein
VSIDGDVIPVDVIKTIPASKIDTYFDKGDSAKIKTAIDKATKRELALTKEASDLLSGLGPSAKKEFIGMALKADET